MFNINNTPDFLPKEIVLEASRLSTSLLCDSMSGLGAMDYRIKPVAPGMKFAGTAFTVNIKNGNGSAVIASVSMAKNGHVLVISGKGNSSNAVFGDLMARIALKSGINGIVLDGLVRDTAELREVGIPIFALGATPSAAEKEGPGEINSSVSCGGIVVHPGDLIVGDCDGVVVVPRDEIDSVLSVAKSKANAEAQLLHDIENGLFKVDCLKSQVEGLKFVE